MLVALMFFQNIYYLRQLARYLIQKKFNQLFEQIFDLKLR